MQTLQISRAAVPALVSVLALGLTACGHENDEKAADPASVPSSADRPTSVRDPIARSWPAFAPTDYTYRLEVLCFCPLTGPLEITVADGEVTSAKQLRKPAKGAEAPAFARLTINDIIDKANDPAVAKADVTWPDGADHPSKVAIDQIENATDDEVTYVVKDVRVTP